jgi:hypothetical protein
MQRDCTNRKTALIAKKKKKKETDLTLFSLADTVEKSVCVFFFVLYTCFVLYSVYYLLP